MPSSEIDAGSIGAADAPGRVLSEATGVAVQQCRAWLNWAAAQIDVCLANDDLASNQLLAALADVVGPAHTRSGPAPASASASAGETIDEKLSAVIIAVQAHDRVRQGLTHVVDSLRALHAQLGDAERADSAESWQMLGETRMREFSMAQERALFARLVAHGGGKRESHIDTEETVELFAAGLQGR